MCAVVITVGTNATDSVDGGGLPSPYTLHSIHFHWSTDDRFGSEHTVDGRSFPLEAHFVHVRHGHTLSSATQAIDGLAVIGVNFELSDRLRPDTDWQFQLLEQVLDRVTNASE